MSSPGSSSSSSHRGYSWHNDGNESSTCTTPEPFTKQSHQNHNQNQHQHRYNSKILAQIHPQQQTAHKQIQRRASTPAQNFLQPRIFYHTYMHSNPGDHDAVSTTISSSSSVGSGSCPPRHMSFGSALGGRLAALSSFRGAVASGNTWPIQTNACGNNTIAAPTQNQTVSTMPSIATSPALRPVVADVFTPMLFLPAISIPAPSDVAPQPPKQQQQQQQQQTQCYQPRHICVPDGCGGFVTVEQRSRRASQA